MDKHLNTGIKEVIDQFPAVGDILKEYGIECVTCSVGICRLRDVVEVHRLAVEEERELLARIGSVMTGAGDQITPVKIVQAGSSRAVVFSPAMTILVEEHLLIKRLLAKIPDVVSRLQGDLAGMAELVSQVLDFIVCYADRRHHGKEEDLLFGCFDPGNEMIAAFNEEHRLGRELVASMRTALGNGDGRALASGLEAYHRLLAEHIRKEDNLLFPRLDSQLSAGQQEELLARFTAADQKMLAEADRHLQFIENLEKGLLY